MVDAGRGGRSIGAGARHFRVDPGTVRRWVRHADLQRLDRADFSNRPSGPRRACNRTPEALEEQVLELRGELKEGSDLGEHGARAIRAAMVARGLEQVPSERTIARIVSRRGAVERRYRLRRPAPPRGWYLPALASGQAEMDCFDIVEGLAIRGGAHFELFNAISVAGALAGSYLCEPGYRARDVLEACLLHWRSHGLPRYAQFDNDSRFLGPHSRMDVLCRVVRLCLSLGVSPVFAIPHETGWQAAIEGFNGLWQRKVWQRFTFESLAQVREQSGRFIAARRAQLAQRIEQAPARPPIAPDWRLDLQRAPSGQIIFLRRSDSQGRILVLGRPFVAAPDWLHRIVRALVDLDTDRITFHGLSRRNPEHHLLLGHQDYRIPKKRFHE